MSTPWWLAAEPTGACSVPSVMARGRCCGGAGRIAHAAGVCRDRMSSADGGG